MQTKRLRIWLTGIVTISIFGLLLWEHFNGGVTSHMILHRDDLPSVSNWWGGLVLPLLTWVLSAKPLKRIHRGLSGDLVPNRLQILNVLGRLAAGLLLGILISVSFLMEYEPVLENIPYLLIALGFFFPIYYSEFIWGFIVGMTYTFGVLLPTVFVLVFALFGFVLFRFVRTPIVRMFKMASNTKD